MAVLLLTDRVVKRSLVLDLSRALNWDPVHSRFSTNPLPGGIFLGERKRAFDSRLSIGIRAHSQKIRKARMNEGASTRETMTLYYGCCERPNVSTPTNGPTILECSAAPAGSRAQRRAAPYRAAAAVTVDFVFVVLPLTLLTLRALFWRVSGQTNGTSPLDVSIQ